MLDKALELLSARWLIHRDTALSYLPLFIAALNGGEKLAGFLNDAGSQLKQDERSKSKVVGFRAGASGETVQYDFDDSSIPDNSIAIIPISGVILPWRSMIIEEQIRCASENDKIIAILFPTNSPGGTVFYVDILAKTIKDCKKPTVAVIMNMAASAAMWLTSAMNYRIATSPMDSIGSIGVFTSFTDMQVLLKEKLGISIVDIYATKSTRKNEMTRQLLEAGNKKPIVDDLDFVNDIFHKAIQDNMGIKADSEVFDGAIYNAQDAITQGLINEINSLDYAIEYAYTAGLTTKINQYKSLI